MNEYKEENDGKFSDVMDALKKFTLYYVYYMREGYQTKSCEQRHAGRNEMCDT